MPGPDEKTIEKVGPIWRELWGGVWHTTRPDRFLSIIDDGGVLPDPPNSDHNGTFAQSLGGVSLFDFRRFDPIKYEVTHPAASWRNFTPYQHQWAGAVWLEVDHKRVGKALIPAEELIEKWHKAEKKPNILPRLEAAHIGNLTLSNILRVIFIRARDEGKFHEFNFEPFDRSVYEALLSEWREDFKSANRPLHEQFKSFTSEQGGSSVEDPELARRIKEGRVRVRALNREDD